MQTARLGHLFNSFLFVAPNYAPAPDALDRLLFVSFPVHGRLPLFSVGLQVSVSMQHEVVAAVGSASPCSGFRDVVAASHCDARTSDNEFVFPHRPLPWLLAAALEAVLPATKAAVSGSLHDALCDYDAAVLTPQALLIACHPAVALTSREASLTWKRVRTAFPVASDCPFS